MLKKSRLLALILCFALFSACGQDVPASTAPATPASPATSASSVSSEPSVSQVESSVEAEAPAEPNVLSTILGVPPEGITHFSYYDTPTLTETSAFLVGGAREITFQCGDSYDYLEEQNALTLRLAHALAAFRVSEQMDIADKEKPLPTGQYFSIWPTLQIEWNPILTFFESGEIYVYVNSNTHGADRYYYAEDPADFQMLWAVLEEIHTEVDALLGDYIIPNPPALPEMTPENEEYCERYVSMWGQYTPFLTDFDEENSIEEFHPFLMYAAMASAEGKYGAYKQESGLDIPADILEDMITRHFLITPEQIRAQIPDEVEKISSYYHPEDHMYHFPEGFGGLSLDAVVSNSHREGDLLTLQCDWYNPPTAEHMFSQELTIQLGEGAYDFVYVSGRILENVLLDLESIS
jgi:hypothetical protein